MRVGFISRWDVADRAALSGMPASMWGALQDAGIDLVHLDPSSRTARSLDGFVASAARALVPQQHRSSVRAFAGRIRAALRGPFLYERMIARATASSRRVGELAAQADVDVLFGVCMSSELYALETDLPVVYASDATVSLFDATYDRYASHPESYRRADFHIEQEGLRRAQAVLPASLSTLRSLVEDYGIAEDRVVLAPMGANLTPTQAVRAEEVEALSRDDVELLVVAADPLRKRVDLCVAATEELVRRGVRARLHVIGPATARALASSVVSCHGRIFLSNETDRALHEDLLRRSHLMLLPSLGEMYGIAPVEAAHFGRPSLVSDTGGLPTVVMHSASGLVLARDASPETYADQIEALCDSPSRYLALSRGALERAHEVLNWEVWGRTAASVLRRVAQGRLVTSGAETRSRAWCSPQ